jgi:YD repeat-containing protein
MTAAKALPTSAYTLSAWIRPTSASLAGGKGIAGRWSANSGAMLYMSGGRPSIVHANQYLFAPEPLTADRWYHVAGTWDGSTARLFVDGELVNQRALTVAPGSGGSAFEVASYSNGYSTTFNHASIDEVALWSRPLTSVQVASLHQAGLSVASVTSRTTYDAEWHPTQVASQHLASPGFESGVADWDFGNGSGGTVYIAPSVPHADVHSGFASFKTGTSGNVQQDVQLVPGQTFRFQVWAKRTGTARARISVYAWNRDAAQWDALINVSRENDSFTGHAWDVTVPQDSDGRIRVSLWTNNGGAGHTVFYDDAALITDYARMTYQANGTPKQAFTFSPASGGGQPGEIQILTQYSATAAHPAIFPSSVTANYVDGAFDPAAPDTDAVSFATFDAWGRTLTATDPDGVTTTSAYAPSGIGLLTDVASSADGLGNTSTYTYDLVGNRLAATSPLGLVGAATFDHLGRPLDETAPDGTVTRHVYDAYGRETSTIANYRDGTPDNDGSGSDDVVTAMTYDAFGRMTRSDADDALIDQVTATSYDLFGNVTSQTAYAAGGTGGARTTTHHFETVDAGSVTYSRAVPTGTQLPTSSLSSPAPLCPGSSNLGVGTRCHTVSELDMNGRTVRSTDAYGIAAVTWNDLAGRPVFAWANYVDGVFSSGAPDTDLLTATTYDLAGRALSVTDVAGRITTTDIDALGRAVEVTRHNGSFSRTVFTPGGRIERTSRLAASSTASADLVWTRTEYDAAGRAVRTLDHFAADGDAHYLLDALETGSDGWSGAALSGFLGASATLSLDGPFHAVGPRSGDGRLRVTTHASSANSGASRDLSGQTFVAGRTYRLQASVRAPNGTGLRALLGVAGGSPVSATLTANGSWQTISVDWTPGSSTAANVYGAIRKDAAGSVDLFIDDLQVWEISDPEWNIPTETAYDADGHITASVLPPGSPGAAPMVTTTAYDRAGRTVSVTANARSTYAPRLLAGAAAEGLVAYWPMDERSGSTTNDAFASLDGTVTGTAGWGSAGAVDESRTSTRLDGSTFINVADNAALDLSGHLSLEYWIRSDQLLDSSQPSSVWKGGVNKVSAYGLGWSTHANGGSWRFRIVSGGTDRIATSAAFPVEPGQVRRAGAIHVLG